MRVRALSSILVLVVLLELFLVASPVHSVNTETRYMRYETVAVNGATFYDLNPSQGALSRSNSKTLASVLSEYLYPTSDGSPLQWTPSAAGTHYTLIDDPYTLPWDDADYISATEPGTPDHKIDHFGHTALTTLSAIGSVYVTVRRKGTGGINVGFVIGGVFYSQYISAGTSSYAYINVVFNTNPATGLAWTKAGLDGALLQVQQTGIYGQTAYISQIYLRVLYFTDATCYWGFQVWKRSSAGSDTEITSGTQTFLTKLISDFLLEGAQLRSTTWACPDTVLDATDSIIVGMYLKIGAGSWALHSTYRFSTEQLGAQSLDSATWTLYFYLTSAISVSAVTSTFAWGTATYDSRIENFVWTATSGQSLTFTLNEQVIVTASQSTSKALSLQFGDSITTLSSTQECIAKAFALSSILQVLDSDSASKASAFSASDLLQILGDSSPSKSLGFTIYGLLVLLDNSALGKELWLRAFDALQVFYNNSFSKSVMLQFFDALAIYGNVSVGVAKAFMEFEVFNLVKIVDYVIPLDLFDLAMNFFCIMISVPFLLGLGLIFYRRRRKRLESPNQL